MPLHDWTRVSAGTFHDFHNAWITHLKEALNAGLLPPPYYALGEQRAGDVGPDVLTLRESGYEPPADTDGMVALAAAPPKVELAQEATGDLAYYLARQRSVVIRHASADSIVAVIEIVSPANKHSQQTLDGFADKVIASLRDGIHVLVVDLFPPTDRDQDGIHGFIWHRLLAGTYDAPAERSRTLVSYYASPPLKAYVQSLAVGDALPAMPLFLTSGHYINVPLEETYAQSWAGVPERWRRVIEGLTSAGTSLFDVAPTTGKNFR